METLAALSTAPVTALGGALRRHVDFLLTPHSGDWPIVATLFWPWIIQLVMSWVGFTLYMAWDYKAWRRGTLEADKLPSRHPIHESPLPPEALLPGNTLPLFTEYLPSGWAPRVCVFWYSQLFMVPLVLYNQLVVWPFVSLLVVWPQWARNHAPLGAWGWSAVPAFLACMLVCDQMWYWGHRLMHTRWAWKHLHKMHHVAPQCAISATYVHPWEYALWCICMQLPFAVIGFPMWVHAVPLGWGMLTGSGAHSGYGGDFAGGEKHGTGHHLYHSANFGLLMIADVMWGTHWAPGDPPPNKLKFELGREIEDSFKAVHGAGAEEAARLAEAARREAERERNAQPASADGGGSDQKGKRGKKGGKGE